MPLDVVTLAPGLVVSRIAKGNWQLAERHGAPYARDAAIDDMRRFVEAGVTLFDCADHYLGVEELIGEFRRRHPDHARRLRVSTKLVPDLASLPRLKRGEVQHIVDTSLARLGVERLDLVQFHWWDYRVPGYVDAMHWLDDLKSAGKVGLVGTTNFDTTRLSEIVASGVSVATNQLQYSVAVRRMVWLRSVPRTGSRCCATARSQAASLASAGAARRSRNRRSPTARSSSTG